VSRKQPIVYVWKQVEVTDEHGEITRVNAMVPLLRYHNVAMRQFAEGAEYILAEVEERSRASHNHYFAALHQGFENLPEKIQARWQDVEHMRAWLLVETDWCEDTEFKADDKKEQMRLATFLRIGRPYARISVPSTRSGDGKYRVIVKTPYSQSLKEMKKDRFEASKKAVLDLLEQFVGVPLGTLMKNAGESARRHNE
jgi:hypothetical protein